MTVMKLKNEIRIENLKLLIEEAGTQDKLAQILGISRVYVNRLVTQRIEKTTGKPKNIGEALARKLESAMGKPFGWMDQDHNENAPTQGYVRLLRYDVQSSAGPGANAPSDYTPVLNELEILEEWVINNLGNNAADRIRIITNKGVSMYPTIKDGDFLFVDIKCNYYDGDGIYVIADEGELRTKRLIKEDGMLKIVSDNPAPSYKDKIISARNQDTILICGKVRKFLSLTDAA